jgi:HEAT repeat protein
MKKRHVFYGLSLVLVSLGVLSWVKVFGPIRGLADTNPKVRQRAVEELATSWVPDRVTRLTNALKDAAVEVRIAAAGALGSIGGEAAIAPLIGASQDADPRVSEAAAAALGKIGKPAFEPLLAALEHENIRVRRGAAAAVGRVFPSLQDPESRARAIEQLVGALKDCEVARRVLGTLGEGQILTGYFCDAMGSAARGSAALHGDAVTALGTIGEPALEPLIGALKHEDARVRQGAAVAMGLVLPAVQNTEIRARAAEALIRVLNDPLPDMRRYADAALLTIPEAGVAAAISVWQDDAKRAPGAALQDSEISGRTVERLLRVMADREETRSFGAMALGKIGEGAFEPLLAGLQDDDDRVRTAAALAMQQVLPGVRDPARRARAVEPLIAVLKEDDKTSISYAPHILAEIGEPALEPLLRSVLEQGGRSFAAAAVRQMIGTGANAELARKVIERLIAQLERGNSAAASALGQVLADVEDAAMVQTAVSALITALNNDVPDVRSEAASALGQILSDAPPPATIQAGALSLIEALKDDHPDVRAAAASALGQILGSGEDPQISKKAIEALLTALENESGMVRLHVAGAVGRALSHVPDLTLGRKAVPLLLAMLREPYAKNEKDLEAAKPQKVLTREKIMPMPLTGSTVRLTNILHKDLAAIEALGRIIAALKSAELAQTALPPLGEALQNQRQPYRFHASLALVRIVSGVTDPQFTRQVVPPLITALQDNDASVREHAAEALGSIFSASAEPELAQQAAQPLVASLEDKNAGVRNRAAWALVKIGTKEARDAVRNAGFDPDHPPSVPKRND